MSRARPNGSSRAPGEGVVSLAAVLVPRHVRRRWLAEWQAELRYAWDHAPLTVPAFVHRTSLVLRSLGAIPDALEVRRTHTGDPMLGQDLRLALRSLLRRPGYTMLVVLTLALGIGASTAVFTVVDSVLLRPLPYRDVDRLVEVNSRLESYRVPHLNPAVLDDWEAQYGILDHAARFKEPDSQLVLEEGEPVDLRAMEVSAEFFPLLGMSARLGRVFGRDEIERNERLVVLSDERWRESLGADPEVIGRTVRLSGENHTVIGVMPPEFRYPRGAVDIWIPFPPVVVSPDSLPRRNSTVQAIARLATGVSVEAAQSRADGLVDQLALSRPEISNWAIELTPVGSWRANRDMVRALTLLSGTVACVLLIACANAANLMLIRATASRRDINVRLALGATRGRVMRELLTEAGTLALAGRAVGLLLAWLGVRGIMTLAPTELAYFSHSPIAMDGRVLVFAIGVSSLTVLTFGALPVLQATWQRATLTQGNRSGTGTRQQRRFRASLVSAQLALSVVLLLGAGLLINSFVRLSNVDPGMDVDRVALLGISLSATRYPTPAERAPFYDAIVERVSALPGVESVSILSGVAGSSGFSFATALEAEHASAPLESQPEVLPTGYADTSYFSTLGIPILQGRAFDASDMLPGANVRIVDEDLARALWPDGDAVGRRFRVSASGDWITVVGVAGDVKLHGPDDRGSRFEMYRPSATGTVSYRTIAARTWGDPAALLPMLKAVVHELDPLQPVYEVVTAASKYSESLAKPRFLFILMSAFAAVAAILAAVGLYGVISYTVAQRTREIGVRMALGAARRRIVADVMREGVLLATAGVVVGIGASLYLGRFLEAMLFGIEATDPTTIAAVALLLCAVALLAACVPALRASRVDPVIAIRAEE